MKDFPKRVLVIVFVLLAAHFILSGKASAVVPPYLIIDGNYSYTDPDGDGIGLLTFSSNNPTWATYTDGSDGCPPYWCANGDAIISTDTYGGGTYTSDLIFTAALSNSGSGNPFIFGSGNFSIVENGLGPNPGSGTFFTATLDGLDTTKAWNSLSNIVAGTAPSSRYVTELLANGNGGGNISFSFTPDVGDSENFVGSSSGAVGITIAAPEPLSSLLFVTGGVTLALRRYRKKRN